ncbi:MAG: hypothetical protein US83_C0007G0049 [Candidatus Falkowbacteria bacterium GW2011_GWC2_38_22]|uniref:Type II toxin-antitoxin system RelE/ParE family toxin n=1 Tax=Candidatus Falkowbacteria bacterium GW2011_GWE1_38_31 TaxID=1618638 RepID=A0A0G0JQM9_9BACT|nr:MAG: hypothetical protein US73_C0008G0008 [Candidatus Falkowbacteria bacterium GW2011_GWF2_38_1205]KKQ61313.1 MAG: hypothetical protein US83_C0007G0049 [Candidatus Falkowbacteria bacterium GW2011_GWC2_38_22]KKQ63115.1 MAG: hypothetical protein US84_C0008G0008 [Candidatus Falkowbacteria bacterium GW2011_GWF1_38_22]KKQ65312.1 MAG: hypothetical protein US87_C0008G0008 [Candidatus Falkowbacteria bacterium GW2011_GWE2_38_254]KKQ69888.1 MAG: hypothetical protein US91_C0008G0008 [Candidatus Falkowb
MLKIIYYVESGTNNIPVKTYLDAIKKDSDKAKVMANIFYVSEKDGKAGNFISKNMRGYDFSEIRVKISKNLHRIIYCIWQDDYLVLLHAFSKKEGEETPKKELVIAQEKYLDFKNNFTLHI